MGGGKQKAWSMTIATGALMPNVKVSGLAPHQEETK